MLDSVWFWLYLIPGAALCVTNTLSLLLSNKRYDVEGREIGVGLVYLGVMALLLFMWPVIVVAALIGAVIGAKK